MDIKNKKKVELIFFAPIAKPIRPKPPILFCMLIRQIDRKAYLPT